MALPLTYQDSNQWNHWQNRFTSGLFVAAMALDGQRWLTQDDTNEQQVGDIKDFNGGEIRAMRVGIAGTLNFKHPWFYQLVVATHASDKGYDSKAGDDFTWLDYRLDIPLRGTLTLSAGKQNEPISMDRLLLGTQTQMAERAAVLDAMFQVRNVWVTLGGNVFDGRASMAAGVFNDWFDDGQKFDESANQIVGRVTGPALGQRRQEPSDPCGLRPPVRRRPGRVSIWRGPGVQSITLVRRHRRIRGFQHPHLRPGGVLVQGALPGE